MKRAENRSKAARGWVPDGAIHAIADVLAVPASDAEGVATFSTARFLQSGRSVAT